MFTPKVDPECPIRAIRAIRGSGCICTCRWTTTPPPQPPPVVPEHEKIVVNPVCPRHGHDARQNGPMKGACVCALL